MNSIIPDLIHTGRNCTKRNLVKSLFLKNDQIPDITKVRSIVEDCFR